MQKKSDRVGDVTQRPSNEKIAAAAASSLPIAEKIQHFNLWIYFWLTLLFHSRRSARGGLTFFERLLATKSSGFTDTCDLENESIDEKVESRGNDNGTNNSAHNRANIKLILTQSDDSHESVSKVKAFLNIVQSCVYAKAASTAQRQQGSGESVLSQKIEVFKNVQGEAKRRQRFFQGFEK